MKNKNVFVTGAGGFIGSHLTENLVKLGAKVTAIVRYNSMNSWGFIDSFDKDTKEKINVICGNLKDSDFIRKNMKNIDVVFHLGALISIPYSYVGPRDNFETNVLGTLNIMEAAKENNVEKVIHTSSSEVYGTPDKVPIKEDFKLKGQSPYSASKIGADKVAESFYYSYSLPVVIVRPFNAYGPRQSARAIIPTLITQALQRGKIVMGNPSPTRDLNYVQDIVNGFMCAAEAKKAVGETVNLGTGKEISMGELAEEIRNIINPNIEIIQDKNRFRPSKSEVMRLCCDNSKAKKLLNWEPKINLKEGLNRTISWIKENRELYKSNIYNI